MYAAMLLRLTRACCLRADLLEGGLQRALVRLQALAGLGVQLVALLARLLLCSCCPAQHPMAMSMLAQQNGSEPQHTHHCN